MKYKVEVNRKDCIASGLCYNKDSIHFEADYGNKSAVRGGKGYEISTGDFEDTLLDDVKTVMKFCPASAITVRIK